MARGVHVMTGAWHEMGAGRSVARARTPRVWSFGVEGYEILARQYRTRRGEIDIVAREGGTMVFVEVKARRGQEFGGGAAAVTWRKRRRIALVALEFLARHGGVDVACRFDVVVVTPGPVPLVEVYRNAFAAS